MLWSGLFFLYTKNKLKQQFYHAYCNWTTITRSRLSILKTLQTRSLWSKLMILRHCLLSYRKYWACLTCILVSTRNYSIKCVLLSRLVWILSKLRMQHTRLLERCSCQLCLSLVRISRLSNKFGVLWKIVLSNKDTVTIQGCWRELIFQTLNWCQRWFWFTEMCSNGTRDWIWTWSKVWEGSWARWRVETRSSCLIKS